MRQLIRNSSRIIFPLFFGGAILYWMYRDFNFQEIRHAVNHRMNWTWMLLSFPFGIMAQVFRGWRWRQTLQPIGEKPRHAVCINAIFISYASSLVVPRIGEFMRCGILKRYEGTSFAKSLGTVVTERSIDSLLVLGITFLTLLLNVQLYETFFNYTGTTIDSIWNAFTPGGWMVTLTCILAILTLPLMLFRKLALHHKIKTTLHGIWEGICSLKSIRNIPLFVFFTIAIWGCYFLHYYLTFFCFEATQDLGIHCALTTFIVGTIAVVVPTPNGAGSWHFAVKTMLVIYGVAMKEALFFVLIVHTVQTLLVALLGIYAWVALTFTKKKKHLTS